MLQINEISWVNSTLLKGFHNRFLIPTPPRKEEIYIFLGLILKCWSTSVADFAKSHCRHANKKREQKNRKFGFGGQKKRAKRNTKESVDMPWQKSKTKSAKSKVRFCALFNSIGSVQVNFRVTVWLMGHHAPVFLNHMQNLWSVFMSVRCFKLVDERLCSVAPVYVALL